tara:strand:- start:81 stop:455 length:375 start_codon:yes stop_codon:yes gene_type:complete
MQKLLIIFFVVIVSCTHFAKDNFIVTEDNFKFNLNNSKSFRSSILKHFDNFGISYNKNSIIVDEVRIDKNEYYQSILNNYNHIEYIEDNPNEIFNLIYFADENNEEIILECINAFLRFHAVKKL